MGDRQSVLQLGLRMFAALALASMIAPTASAGHDDPGELVTDAVDGLKRTYETLDRYVDTEIQGVRDNVERVQEFEDDVDHAMDEVDELFCYASPTC